MTLRDFALVQFDQKYTTIDQSFILTVKNIKTTKRFLPDQNITDKAEPSKLGSYSIHSLHE